MAGEVGLQAADGGGGGNRQRHECATAAGSRGGAVVRRCRRRSGRQQRALRHGCAPTRKLLRAGASVMGSADVAASGEDGNAVGSSEEGRLEATAAASGGQREMREERKTAQRGALASGKSRGATAGAGEE
ncbi:hypothetical protein B296_00044945 [Ensete ventricosum]|uniref:Uncharacterized protein n=1 Tax=Ensete ventricosum TaxID=4639 RepID=A0A426WXW4_ENSVE|nr:hypothetical protein B296_00044945 [Ensete ventricosum]